MDFGVDARRLAVEIIATLVHIKSTMVDMILKPSGITSDIYGPLLYKQDEVTGKTLSKRKIAPLILDAVEQRHGAASVLRGLIEIAANWSSFHLAENEFSARATVQKARELLGTIELMEAREAKQRELARKEELARLERERAELIGRQSDLLLMMFDELAKSDDPQKRGYLLQDLLSRTFDLHEFPVIRSFTRNDGAEQIDGAFSMDGWHYLVECRWRKKLADVRELDGLSGQVRRSGKQTMGIFLSINGWSDNVPEMLKQNPDKSVALMDGYDLRCILTRRVDLRDFLVAKLARLNVESEPFFGATEYMQSQA